MYFDNVASLIHMDGHGVYVWATYAFGLVVILYNIVVPLLRDRRVITEIRRHNRRIIATVQGHNHQKKIPVQKEVMASSEVISDGGDTV